MTGNFCPTKHRELQKAFSLLDQMYQCPGQFREWPDEVLYNCLIDMCVRFRDLPSAVRLFNTMHKQGQPSHNPRRNRFMSPPPVKASAVTFGILIKAYG